MSNFIRVVAVCLSLAVASEGFSKVISRAVVDTDGKIGIQSMKFFAPREWRPLQDIVVDGTIVMSFVKGDGQVTIMAKKETGLSMESIFANDARVTRDIRLEPRGQYTWKVMSTRRRMPTRTGFEFHYVTSFLTEVDGYSYYGYSTALSAAQAENTALDFLDSFQSKSLRDGQGRSLTGDDYTGKKYYFGWGSAHPKDPNLMHNEVKYDVLHTHDIFTQAIGGNYLGTKLIGPNVNRDQIYAEWNRIKDVMTPEDMYVQYSSGHGHQTALMVGVTYNEMRDMALSYPAKEIIIFTMACKSGGLVDAFNNKKSVWQDWGAQGRTLMVLSSSKTSQNSATGPGTDKDEAGGPKGSAGSAFGHALWKSLIGYADGFVDGVKDGYISLGEIQKFTVYRTKQLGGHTPVSTGVYNDGLIMNKVPPKAYLATLRDSTEGLSDDEILRQVQALDAELRIR